MRAFSEEEGIILSRLDELAGTTEQQRQGETSPVSLYSLIQLKMNDAGFIIDTYTKSVSITFENSTQEQLTRVKELQLIIVQSVNLLKLLEDKGYIFTFKKETSLNPIVFGQYQFENPSSPYTFFDQRIADLVIKYSLEEVYPTLELNHFIKVDKFQTRESARFSKQYKRTTIALLVAIAALLSNIGFNIYNNFYKSKSPSKLDINLTIDKNNNLNFDSTKRLNSDTTIHIQKRKS